jgi:tRNA threonylcarbamoyladenosine biosynthesis protein TsaE
MSVLERLRSGVTTASADETRSLAAELASVLPVDVTLALHGNLGVGKTTFVQGLARGFGVAGHVTSPTFTIYTLHHGGKRTLVHLDAYRLTGGAQLEELMLDDFLKSPYCVAVEWPDHIADWLPADAWHLDLAIVAGERHTLQLR